MNGSGEKGSSAEVAEKEVEEGAEEEQDQAAISLRASRSVKRRYREQALVAVVKWFVAASVIWLALSALRRKAPCCARNPRVRLGDGADLERWAEAILAHNTTPHLEEVLPEKQQQAMVYINAHRFLKDLQEAKDATRRMYSRTKLYELYQKVRTRLETQKTK